MRLLVWFFGRRDLNRDDVSQQPRSDDKWIISEGEA